jgi:hypothetical protein
VISVRGRFDNVEHAALTAGPPVPSVLDVPTTGYGQEAAA